MLQLPLPDAVAVSDADADALATTAALAGPLNTPNRPQVRLTDSDARNEAVAVRLADADPLQRH
jgi:hypothetical protein